MIMNIVRINTFNRVINTNQTYPKLYQSEMKQIYKLRPSPCVSVHVCCVACPFFPLYLSAWRPTVYVKSDPNGNLGCENLLSNLMSYFWVNVCGKYRLDWSQLN